MADINVLLIGSGGREHAIAWKLAASPLLGRLHSAPGNPGIAEHALIADVDPTDHAGVIDFCRSNDVGLVVVGPEAPLVAGIVDDLQSAGIKAFGPNRAAAMLEASKGFTKDLCREHGIPTADYRRFSSEAEAIAYVRSLGAPLVVKADGLAAGKGVTVATRMEDAESAVREIFSGRFGAGSPEAVIEAFLDGEEASFFALVDGETALPLATAQDHKRAGNGDTGPNTGGMGAYSPAGVMTGTLVEETMERIIRPTVKAMAARGAPFKGVLFAGLMLTREGPSLIEYNVRFGDPECQVLMMRLVDDLLPLLMGSVDGTLSSMSARWSPEAALTVVMAAEGYPGPTRGESLIRGIADADAIANVKVFHAGTRREGTRLLANGGRVLNVTATGRTVRDAQASAYGGVAAIDWPQGYCRSDIGWRAVEREALQAVKRREND